MQTKSKRILFGALAVALFGGGSLAFAALTPDAPSGPLVTVYKSPTCGCCGKWVEHMKDKGFTVQVREMADVTPIKERYDVPQSAYSCHTSVVDGYALEGHVPAEDVRRLLEHRPRVAGLAAPGMPSSAPGMDGPRKPYDVLAFTRDGETRLFASH